jgi:hypothetical protein
LEDVFDAFLEEACHVECWNAKIQRLKANRDVKEGKEREK